MISDSPDAQEGTLIRPLRLQVVPLKASQRAINTTKTTQMWKSAVYLSSFDSSVPAGDLQWQNPPTYQVNAPCLEALKGIGDNKSYAILWWFLQKMKLTLFKSGESLLPAYPRHRADKPCASFSTNWSAEGCLKQSNLRKRKVRGDHWEVFWGVDSTERKLVLPGICFSYKLLSWLGFAFSWVGLLPLSTSNRKYWNWFIADKS